MKARTGRHTKDEALLISMAESIGSTLGSIAAKADAAQKALKCGRRSRDHPEQFLCSIFTAISGSICIRFSCTKHGCARARRIVACKAPLRYLPRA